MEIVREFNKEIVLQLMKERGYGLVSESNSEKNGQTFHFAKTVDLGVCLHASVYMKPQMMSLDMVELKYFASLTMQRFDFFHKDFNKIENILYLYSRSCLLLGSTVIKTAETMGPVKNKLPDGNLMELPQVEPDAEPEAEKPKKEKKDIKQRMKDFWMEIVPIAKQKGLDKDFTMEFFSYWTEHGPNDRTFRKETEKKFDISKRLDTFVRNEKKWNMQRKTIVEKVAETQNQNLQKGNQIIDKKKVF